jgi:hypothetical protein
MDYEYEDGRKWLYIRELSGARIHQQKNKQTFFYCSQPTLKEEIEFSVKRELSK